MGGILNYLFFFIFLETAYIALIVQMKCVHEAFSKVNIGIGTVAWITSQMWHLELNKVLLILAARILKLSPKQLETLQWPYF